MVRWHYPMKPFLLFLLSEKNFQKNPQFSLKNHFLWKKDEFGGGSWGLLLETILIRKSLIHSIRIVLCDKLELHGTRANLEKRTLLRGNFSWIRLNMKSSILGLKTGMKYCTCHIYYIILYYIILYYIILYYIILYYII